MKITSIIVCICFALGLIFVIWKKDRFTETAWYKYVKDYFTILLSIAAVSITFQIFQLSTAENEKSLKRQFEFNEKTKQLDFLTQIIEKSKFFHGTVSDFMRTYDRVENQKFMYSVPYFQQNYDTDCRILLLKFDDIRGDLQFSHDEHMKKMFDDVKLEMAVDSFSYYFRNPENGTDQGYLKFFNDTFTNLLNKTQSVTQHFDSLKLVLTDSLRKLQE